MKKSILITGSRGGFGCDTAFKLAGRGHHVYATTKTQEEADKLNQSASENGLKLNSFKLDITNHQDLEKVKDINIDVLINNAAVAQSGPLSEINIDRIRKNFEVNVFSTLALSQIVVEKMLQKNSGTIIFISSLAGRLAFSFIGPYSMTKHSLSAAAEIMRNEIHRINKNIHVSVVEPGAYHTGFNQSMRETKFEWLDNSSNYSKIIDDLKREDENFKKVELKSTTSIVNQIVKASESNKPKLRYSAPWYQAWGVRLLRALGK